MENNPEKSFWISGENERPAYTIQTEMGFYHLTPENTRVRRFDVEDGEFDYAYHLAPNDSGFFVWLRHHDFLNQYLEDKGYFTERFTELDEATIGYYAAMEATELDDLPDAA